MLLDATQWSRQNFFWRGWGFGRGLKKISSFTLKLSEGICNKLQISIGTKKNNTTAY